MSDRLHETHVCRDCGAEITLPFANRGRPLTTDERIDAALADGAWVTKGRLAEALRDYAHGRARFTITNGAHIDGVAAALVAYLKASLAGVRFP